MSESLSNDRSNEITEQVHEEFSVTILRVQFFLEDRGVEFVPSLPTQAEHTDDTDVFMDRVKHDVAEQEQALGRMLHGDELTDIMEHYYQELEEATRRLEIAGKNSLAIIRITQKIMGYWWLVHNGTAEGASQAKQDLYMDVKESGLPDAWYELLDNELAG